jgi:hypothetical protein
MRGDGAASPFKHAAWEPALDEPMSELLMHPNPSYLHFAFVHMLKNGVGLNVHMIGLMIFWWDW